MKTKSLQGMITRGADGAVTFVASTANADRADDVVTQNWDLSEFNRNPVILYMHDHSTVVGKGSNARVEAGKLLIDVTMDDHSPDPLVQRVAHQVDKGFLNAVSVGFMPGSITSRAALPKEHRDYSEGSWGLQLGDDAHPNVLRELSVVALGMNEEAQRRSADQQTPRDTLKAQMIDLLTNDGDVRKLLAPRSDLDKLFDS